MIPAAFLLLTQVSGLRLGESLSLSIPPQPTYSCPEQTGSRPDARLEFFTASRQFDSASNPPVIQVEIPRNWTEFMCGFANRNLTAGCNCGFFFAWDDPGFRTFYPRSIPFDSQLVMLDKFQSVIAVANATAYAQAPINAPQNLHYAVLVQAGLVQQFGVALGDPIQIQLPNGTYLGSGPPLADDKIGIHN